MDAEPFDVPILLQELSRLAHGTQLYRFNGHAVKSLILSGGFLRFYKEDWLEWDTLFDTFAVLESTIEDVVTKA